MEETQKDAGGIPIDLGNRHARRALAKINKKGGLGSDVHTQFEREPVWVAMEKVTKKLKEFYALNSGWIFTDKEAMAVVESMRKDHEAAESKMQVLVAEAREAEHRRIDEVFARVHDKKTLKLQLKYMKEEYDTLQRLAKLQTAKRKQNG